jgi:hypothetical protein
MDGCEREIWTLLQALAVLYAYPRVAAVSKQDGERHINPWTVKSAVETCAMQISIHQSVEDLKTLIQSCGPEILSSLPYRRTFFWRVLAEAALYYEWDQAARLDQSLIEWWCVPPDTKDGGVLSELLEGVENLLQEWHSDWLPPVEINSPTRTSIASNFRDPSIFANSITAFMGILTRFNIISFAHLSFRTRL